MASKGRMGFSGGGGVPPAADSATPISRQPAPGPAHRTPGSPAIPRPKSWRAAQGRLTRTQRDITPLAFHPARSRGYWPEGPRDDVMSFRAFQTLRNRLNLRMGLPPRNYNHVCVLRDKFLFAPCAGLGRRHHAARTAIIEGNDDWDGVIQMMLEQGFRQRFHDHPRGSTPSIGHRRRASLMLIFRHSAGGRCLPRSP